LEPFGDLLQGPAIRLGAEAVALLFSQGRHGLAHGVLHVPLLSL
jgi:hypothetical protein